LPNSVVDVVSYDLFKSILDNFWMFQDVNSFGADIDKSWHKGPGAEVNIQGSSAVTDTHSQRYAAKTCIYIFSTSQVKSSQVNAIDGRRLFWASMSVSLMKR